MYEPKSKEEKDFLEKYDPDAYPKPSVTADIVIFTLPSDPQELSVLLIRRGGFPFRGNWALPGGFVNINESVDDAAARELAEETQIKDLHIEQVGTFGDVDRDPRMRVISVAYMAFAPLDTLHFKAGDDAADAQLFRIRFDLDGMVLVGGRNVVKESELAFDHAAIIRTAVRRLRNRIDYTDDAFYFLKDDQSFTRQELKKIYDAVKGQAVDASNFRRTFETRFLKPGLVTETGGERDAKRGKTKVAEYRKLRSGSSVEFHGSR